MCRKPHALFSVGIMRYLLTTPPNCATPPQRKLRYTNLNDTRFAFKLARIVSPTR